MAELADDIALRKIESLIANWRDFIGTERQGFSTFVGELCDALDLPKAKPGTDYALEYDVLQPLGDGRYQTRWIDLYRKWCFVMEAKRNRFSVCSDRSILEDGPGRQRYWDASSVSALRQAEGYARCLPPDHGWPPFLIVCEVGRGFEIYADFSCQGKNYVQFPDRARFRISLEDLRESEVRDRLKAIWHDPLSLDPARRAARLSRQIAERLAAASRRLEDIHGAEEVPIFLMRCLFTMFAEDAGLLKRDAFKMLLRDGLKSPDYLFHSLGDLWSKMNSGGYCVAIQSEVRRFNGSMFDGARPLELDRDSISEILAAAECDWTELDTAIFGTLLEQALDPQERAKLGAHYTPRAYVEPIVVAVIIAPLRDDWRLALAAAQREQLAGREKEALAAIETFHKQLCTTRVLDPACGTGNFLHVAQDLMQRLEGEVLETMAELGGLERLGGFSEREVGPGQFFGIDANKRAVAITQLMLWIGYLQWHLRARPYAPREPILRSFETIRWGDALMTWPEWPIPKVSEGREVVPDRIIRVAWPEAEFIVGNPPFIGGKDLRKRLGDGYAEGLWTLYPEMNRSADLVMYWWSRAAEILVAKGSKLRRFGFVTTNSITQLFQRRVVARHLEGRKPVSIVMAIPDHPWTLVERSSAAVRIAMTVVEAGGGKAGKLMRVVSEGALDTDQPEVMLVEHTGLINSDLSVGVHASSAYPLAANEGLCSPGVKLHGDGFLVSQDKARTLGLGRRRGLELHIRPYHNGKDLTGHSRGLMVIDLLGLSAEEVRTQFPEVYQHLKLTVKECRDEKGRPNGRDVNRDPQIRANWWLHGRPRSELRPALKGLPRYIATVETAKHRVFQFLPAEILPDNMLIAIASSDGFHLGVLSSRFHVAWALRQGATLEDRPRYSKSLCFDPFPFPEASDLQRRRIAKAADALDALRKQVLADHPDLTLTKLYNVRAKLRGGQSLTKAEMAIRDRGLVTIIDEHHDEIDAAVAAAYGWAGDIADADAFARLVALNAGRAKAEKRGTIQWLRPDLARAPAGARPKAKEGAIALPVVKARRQVRMVFPSKPIPQVAAVLAAMGASAEPQDADLIASRFRNTPRVPHAVKEILEALTGVGEASRLDGGRYVLRNRQQV